MRTYLYEVKFYIPSCLNPIEDIIEVKAETREGADDMVPLVAYEYLLSNWPNAHLEEVTYLDCAE